MKIIVIWCPGSGKSTFTKTINNFLNYPVLHLDKIYHINDKNHITREELIKKVKNFTSKYNKWIIDWNYISTINTRIKLADTIILLNISSRICLKNVYKRSEDSIKYWIIRDDMVKWFNESLEDDFINFIKNFEIDTFPKIIKTLKNYKNKKVIIINNYEEFEDTINKFKIFK